MIERVTVYCSSSRSVHPGYLEEAERLGRMLGASGRTLVYGGGKLGMMGVVSRAVRDGGGRVVGISTERLREAEQLDEDCHESIVVDSMSERKALMVERGDAIVVMPGGVGTLEEFFEVFVGRLVGEHDKPIIIVNMRDPIDETGFYQPLMAMFEHVIESGFARPAIRELFVVCETADQAMAELERAARGDTSVGDRRRFMPGLTEEAES